MQAARVGVFLGRMRSLLLVIACAGVFAADPPSPPSPSPSDAPEHGAVKVAFSFKEEGEFQMAITPDSVGILPVDSFGGALEPDDEHDGLEHALGKRALSASERDTAAILLGITRSFRGDKRFVCDRDEGYGFSLWSDSLTLHCRNCFSCSDGIGMREARTLARLGKLSLWLYRMRDGLAP